MNALKRTAATLVMLAAAATLSLTTAGTASAVDADVLAKLETGFAKLSTTAKPKLQFDAGTVPSLDLIASGSLNVDSGVGIYAPDAEANIHFGG